jgi:vacuolar-type H+-ATPase subunit I/STV1
VYFGKIIERLRRAILVASAALMVGGIIVSIYQSIVWIFDFQWDASPEWDSVSGMLWMAGSNIGKLDVRTAIVAFILDIPLGVIMFVVGSLIWALHSFINSIYQWITDYYGYY